MRRSIKEMDKRLDEREQEIERLNIRIEDLITIIEEHQILNEMIRNQLQQKENIIKEVYTKSLDTSITSLDLRDYIINNLGDDK